jgi:hypothetical protein
VLSLIVPRWYNFLVPIERLEDDVRPYAPGVTDGLLEGDRDSGMEVGSGDEVGETKK